MVALVALVSVAPVLRLLFEAVAPGGRPDLSNVASVLAARSTWTATWHSLVTATASTIVSLLLGLMFALPVALTDIRAKAPLVFCFLLPMMIPPQVTALAWVQLFGPASPLLNTLGIAPRLGTPNPIYSPEGIILLLGIQHAPLVFLAVRAGLRALPRELIEAARSCGGGRTRVLLTVVLPLMTPALVASGALAFVSSIGNFGIPALIGIPAGYTVLPTLIYQRLSGFGPAIISETAVLSVLVGLLACAGFALQALMLRRRDYRLTGAPSQALLYPLGRWRAPVEGLAWAIIALIVAAPLLALLATSLVSAYGVALTPSSVTIGNYVQVLLVQDATVRAFRNSFLLAGGAALVLMAAAIPLGLVFVWRKNRLLKVLNAAVEIPYALPGVVLGIASILLFLKPLPVLGLSLYNTIWIIFFAYLSRFLILSLRPVVAGVMQMDRALDEAAAVSGARFLFRLWTIVLPLLAPMAAAGGILIFLTALNELTVSALLWSSGNETLGVVVFNLDDSGLTTLASALAFVTVVLIVAVMTASSLAAGRLPKGVLPWTA